MSATINPFEVALKQLDEAAKIIKLDKGLHQVLAHPKRVLTVSLPVKMDNGEVIKYEVYETRTIKPTDVSILNSTSDSRLTLYTCAGFLDTARFVVLGKLI